MDLRRLTDRLFGLLCGGAAAFGSAILIFLVVRLLVAGLPRLNLAFLEGRLSSRPWLTGVGPALSGSLWLVGLAALVSAPVGVGAAVYLEEFAPKESRLARVAQVNLAHLASVPAIVYGLLGLAVFVRGVGMGPSVLAGSLTLSLLILPSVILVTQQALRAVPRSVREASFGLGADTWATIRYQVLPYAAPNILTGVVLALSRAVGETAPLIVVGAVVGIVSAPQVPTDRFTALPVEVFEWSRAASPLFHEAASAAVVVLLGLLLALNLLAAALRRHFGG